MLMFDLEEEGCCGYSKSSSSAGLHLSAVSLHLSYTQGMPLWAYSIGGIVR